MIVQAPKDNLPDDLFAPDPDQVGCSHMQEALSEHDDKPKDFCCRG